MSLAPSPNNLLLGHGVLYFDQFDSSGVKTGELDLGNCTAFSITPSVETKEKRSSRTAQSGLLQRAVVSQNYSLKITGDEFSAENLALTLLGSVSTVSQTTSTITGETITTSSVQGRWYPVSKRMLSTVVVKVSSSAKTLGTDYKIDATLGRIYIVPGGGIVDGSTVTVDASAAVISAKPKVIAGTTPNLVGYLRYVADPVTGPKHHVQCWRVNLTPSGELGFITDDYGNWELTGEILDDSTNHPTEPYFTIEEL